MLCGNLQQNFPGTFSHFKRSRIIYRCADKRMSRDMCATTLITAMEFSNGVNCWLYYFLKTLSCFLSINEANDSLWCQARIRFLRFLAACIINDGLNSQKKTWPFWSTDVNSKGKMQSSEAVKGVLQDTHLLNTGFGRPEPTRTTQTTRHRARPVSGRQKLVKRQTLVLYFVLLNKAYYCKVWIGKTYCTIVI